ncbi:MAG: YdcF family protein [Cytophagales bacterium]|nr:YdcF family protein [Cytophagales bacterium]
MKRFFKWLMLLLIFYFVLDSLFTTIYGVYNHENQSCYGVVLGNKVNEDGTLSMRLKARLDKALDLYNRKLIDTLVVSGGLGKEGFWEAEKMKMYLVAHNVSKSKIIVDNYGNTTWLTGRNCLNLLDHARSVVVISQFYHVRRTVLCFEKWGFQDVCGASPTYFEWRDFYALFREFFAIYSYRFRRYHS